METTAAPVVAAPVTAPAAIGSGQQATAPINAATIAANAKPGETSSQTVKRMLKAKVDGKEIEVPEDEAIAAWQKKASSEKRFQEAATTRKQAEQFLGLLKRASADPSVLEQVFAHPLMGNVNFQNLAEQYLYGKIKTAQMTPEQREAAEAKAELARIKEEQRLAQEEKEANNNAELEKQYTNEYHQDIIQALDGSNLPKSEWAVKRIASYMHMGLQRGVELKAAEVLPLVIEDYKAEFKSLFGGMPGEKLVDILGEDVTNTLRSFDLEKFKAGQGGAKAPTLPTPEPTKGKRLTMEEFKARARARANA